MTNKTKVTINKDTITVEGDSLLSKALAGCKGKIKLKTPFGERELKIDKTK